MTKRSARITQFDLISFSQRFREERAHWDDGELGYCMTLTPSAIAEIEAGKVNPDGYLLFKMAACGLDIQYIITGVRSGNTYDVAASIGRFDEFEAETPDLAPEEIAAAEAATLGFDAFKLEERALTPAEVAAAEAMTHKPIWSNGHRPKWWSHVGVRAVLTSAHRQMTLQGAAERVRHLFGPAQVPSSSSIHRYWQRLDVLFMAEVA
ncbi:MAG: helix-turn-helix transcriptional regulator [Rhizobium sp.]|nr:helix-turn-helix transcriptional regulator [Rhizobium sp.]